MEIGESYSEEKKFDQISTRSMNNKNPYSYFNTLPNQNSSDPNSKFFFNSTKKGKLPIFDFHIKKIDDSAYEKIVID